MATLTAAQLTTLRTAFEARYSLALRVNLTNVDDVEATTQDDDRVDVAFQDVASDFEILGGTLLDESDNNHVRTACRGAIALLREGAGAAGQQGEENYSDVETVIKKLSLIAGRNRIIPDAGTTTAAANAAFRPSKFRGISPGR